MQYKLLHTMLILVFSVTVGFFARTNQAYAQEGDSFGVTIGSIVSRGHNSGDIVDLGTWDVPEKFQGHQGEMTVCVDNNRSVHLGHTAEFTSNSGKVSIPNVENVANTTVCATGSMTLGKEIHGELVIGQSSTTSISGGLVTFTIPKKQISAKGEGECVFDSNEWHWVITGLQAPDDAPTSILVEWSDGSIENVPLDKVNGDTAHYATHSHGASGQPLSVTTDIYGTWSGQFNLSHKPCVPTATPTNTLVPTATPTNTLVPTATPTNTLVPTATPTNTLVPTATPTNTLVPTATPTNTLVPTATPTTKVPTTEPPTPTPVPQCISVTTNPPLNSPISEEGVEVEVQVEAVNPREYMWIDLTANTILVFQTQPFKALILPDHQYVVKVSQNDTGCILFAPTPVELLSMKATQTEKGVTVEWITGMELETWGFYILNGPSSNDRVSIFIPASGSNSTYRVDIPQEDLYWLEEVAVSGYSSFFGPVKVNHVTVTADTEKLFIPHVTKH